MARGSRDGQAARRARGTIKHYQTERVVEAKVEGQDAKHLGGARGAGPERQAAPEARRQELVLGPRDGGEHSEFAETVTFRPIPAQGWYKKT